MNTQRDDPIGSTGLELPMVEGPEGIDKEEQLKGLRDQLFVFARETSNLYARERQASARLEDMMGELRNTYLSIVQTLAFVVEAHDEYTRNHLERCREYATNLMMKIDPSLAVPEVQYGFLLHDVGKIGVPDAILSKPGALSDEETRLMRIHPITGVSLVAPMRFLDERALQVIRSHHERFDGGGYPDGLRRDEIPLAARAFAVVDAFDAMTSDRPYRQAISIESALDRISSESGTQFDPDVVDAFLAMVRDRRG